MSAGILIAGWSGRMLAASARRAGHIPLVVDAFGDEDTLAAAHHHVRLPRASTQGFRAAPLIAALDRLVQAAPCPPIGLVLGSGFEDRPGLVTALARRYRLLGCGPDMITRTKDPAHFYPLLASLGIPHPETRLERPAEPAGWLTRRTGGTGGNHIHPLQCLDPGRTHRIAAAHRYYQRRISADANPAAISLGGVVSANGLSLGFCRQWLAPTPAHPFRFGGICGPVTLDPDLEARLIDTVIPLVRALDLKGLVSFDFLITGGEPLLLEVNPRPGASLDCLDDGAGSLFSAHIAAAQGARFDVSAQRRDGARALAYLYADRGPLRLPAVAWPDHVSDRPPPGSLIARGQPIATVFADDATPACAETLCRRRLEELEEVLYGTAG